MLHQGQVLNDVDDDDSDTRFHRCIRKKQKVNLNALQRTVRGEMEKIKMKSDKE